MLWVMMDVHPNGCIMIELIGIHVLTMNLHVPMANPCLERWN